MSNEKMSSLSHNRVMIPASYRNFNLFKQHLGRRERYVQDMTDKATLCLPLWTGTIWGCQKRVTAYSSCTVRSNLDLLCLFAHYRKVLTCRYASSNPSSLQHALCSVWFFFFLVQPHTPTVLCMLLWGRIWRVSTESSVFGFPGLQGPELRALILQTACR